MRVSIITPLFPPDLGGAALYTKELARRLAPKYAVTVLAYGHLPEKVEGVPIITVDKRRPLFVRLLHFTFALWKTARKSDVLIIENGPSVELPLACISFILRQQRIVHIGDVAAFEYTSQKFLLHAIQKRAFKHAQKIIREIPLQHPEIFSFRPTPQKELNAHETSWKKHLELLEDLFTYGT